MIIEKLLAVFYSITLPVFCGIIFENNSLFPFCSHTPRHCRSPIARM